MLDDYKKSQPLAWKILTKQIKSQKYSHAYLFESNGCSDVDNLVLSFVKSLLCPNNYFNNEKCGECFQCQNIQNNNFPEIKIIEAEGLWIKKKQLTELQQQFQTKSINSKKQIYIIQEASKLNNVAANSLLKFIEEPAENIMAFLITSNRYLILPTIISRCQIISLIKNINNEQTMIEKIANYLYNNNQDIQKFITDEKSILNISSILEFIQMIELQKSDSLLYTSKYWTSCFKSKEDLIIAFEIMLLYYKDVLNFQSNKINLIFDVNNIEQIARLNTVQKTCYKIEKIIDLKNYIKINANVNLLIDKLIIELGGGIKNA
ncbi:MAG: hypothetical protein RR847_02670 [Bacilli bacterium]